MKKLAVFLLFSVAIIYGCEGRNKMPGTGQDMSSEKLSESDILRLSSSKYYFGHQSVGDNMLDGIDKIAKRDNRMKLRVIKSKTLFTIHDGQIEVPQGPGLGLDLDDEALERFRGGKDRSFYPQYPG